MKVLLEKSSVNGVTIHWLDLWEHVDPKPGFRYPKLLDGFIPFLPSTNSGM